MIEPIVNVAPPLLEFPVRENSTPDTAFLRTLIRRLGGEPGPVDQTPVEAADRLAETGARRLMADAFLVPLLKEARESSAAEGMFAPGPGEKRFGSMLDQAYADNMLESKSFPLVDSLFNKLRASFHRVAGLQAPQLESQE